MSAATSHQPPATVADLSETELIARIRDRLPPAPPWLLVGIGDDAAVVEPEHNRAEVLSVDALVEGVHFDRAFVPPDAIGHRALAVNLSDLAAMGAAPRLALLSMVLPPALPADDFDAIVGGFTALAARHKVHVVGGNLTRSPGPLMIDVTVLGTVKRRQALTRAGARAGDSLYVSGTIGAAGAGLQMLRAGTSHPPSQAAPAPAGQAQPPATSHLLNAYLRPEPRVKLGLLLGRNRAISACMDLSDGLADAAHQMAAASGVGMTIDADALPIDPGARAWNEARQTDATDDALTAGDDYELLVAVRPRARRRATALAARAGAPLTCIGTCTGDGVVLLRRTSGGTAVDAALTRQAYAHFR
ncbi:MAG: thiamine-phosphate kinase [Acidobacteria bacterium]|nr:thiamine-phosphate kinase [Acidobacteriota bacterium]